MQTMILAAGRSTRLGSIGLALPKPLLPVCGYPAITFAIELCRRAGLLDVIVNLHHHGDKVGQLLGDGSGFGVRLRYSHEEELLGTGGALWKARPMFGPGPVLVINGKVAADVDLNQVIAAHRRAPEGTLATMVLRDDPNPELWAPIGVDPTGAVFSIRGKRGDRTALGSILPRMFVGIHVIEPALLDRLPEGVSDIIGDAYIPALLDGCRISSLTMEGYFAEHSTPERYLAGNFELLQKPEILPQAPGPLAGIDPGAQVDASATVKPPVRIAAGAVIEAGAEVGPLVAVSPGGRVAAGAQVARSVVWPGATATGKQVGAVIGPGFVYIAESTPGPQAVAPETIP
ncbi:MAG: NDP-sugar synthase [Deltaproteobacteria bacterium]|nr:NDP-sugar synthase [Deltaproteobacteria bacterium]